MLSNSFTEPSLALCTKPVCTRFLYCFLVFLVKMWLWKACFLLILPVPVRANLFLAPELVLIFGILFKFKIIIINGGNVLYRHVTHFLIQLFLPLSLVQPAFPSSERQPSSEPTRWSFSYLPISAFAQPSHILPNRWQNGATTPRLVPWKG